MAFEEWPPRDVLAGTGSALEKEVADNTCRCFPAYLGGLPGGSGAPGGLTGFIFKLGFLQCICSIQKGLFHVIYMSRKKTY